jgi:hypothetical protein
MRNPNLMGVDRTLTDEQIDNIARTFSDLIDMDNASPSANVPTVMARIGGAIREALDRLNELNDQRDNNSRAPERRIFYIDVGNLPKQKAEQYVRDLMNKYRNKLIYDASTGEIRNDETI